MTDATSKKMHNYANFVPAVFFKGRLLHSLSCIRFHNLQLSGADCVELKAAGDSEIAMVHRISSDSKA